MKIEAYQNYVQYTLEPLGIFPSFEPPPPGMPQGVGYAHSDEGDDEP